MALTALVFQSTRSARSATILGIKSELPVVISIHALREERDSLLFTSSIVRLEISIHALREERDITVDSIHFCDSKISIHALREERDPATAPTPWPPPNFNPRAPRGARQVRP